jgi:exopolyphosphatase/pppGpp-phosphohydrolase
METKIHQQYRAIRRSAQDGTPITMLHIGEQNTAVVTGAGREPERVQLLAIGSDKTAAEYFAHTPPTLVEMENAILHVEDEITRARETTAGYAVLVTADESIREISRIISRQSGTKIQLTIEAVEELFALLASISLGNRTPKAGVPTSTTFAARVLILREFMHHLGFSSISIMD